MAVAVGLSVFAAVSGGLMLPAAAVPGAVTMTGNDTAGTATFNRTTITEHSGDIAAITVNLTDTETATITVGSDAVNYETNVTVNDTDANGRVTLLMNTYLAGTRGNETGVYEAGNDTVVAMNRSTGPLDAPLEPSTYNLSVAVGGDETDTATLKLTRPTRSGLVTWTAPAAAFDNVTNASAVAAAVNAGRITTTDTIAKGDVLVNQFKIAGIYGALSATNFSTLVERGTLDFTIVQTNPETNRPPKRLDVNRSFANNSIRVIPDERNDVLYVNVDTGAAVFENGTPAAGDEFEVKLTYNGTAGSAGRNQSPSANVTFVGAEMGLGTVSLVTDRNQTITGTTSLAPGSEVTVRLQRNGTGSFVKTNTTRVQPNGSFAVAFNLSAISPRSPVTVRAVGPLNTSDSTTVLVRRNRSRNTSASTASLTVRDQTTAGETITIENVTLPQGGFVVIKVPDDSTAESHVRGVSSYLENGTNENVTVTLDRPLANDSRVMAVAHTDSNENQVYDFVSANGTEDRPYLTNGSVIATNATVSVRTMTQTEATAAGEMDTSQTTTATETTPGSGPGFDIALALVALLGFGSLRRLAR